VSPDGRLTARAVKYHATIRTGELTAICSNTDITDSP
jgi:hypothetical protein